LSCEPEEVILASQTSRVGWLLKAIAPPSIFSNDADRSVFHWHERPIDITYVRNRCIKVSAGSYERNMLNPQFFSLGTAALN
jgi:hypothetical protein